jgi:hypothetical protein
MKTDGIGFLFLDAAHPYPTNWPRVAELALRHKLPALSEIRRSQAALSYGVRVRPHTAFCRLIIHMCDRSRIWSATVIMRKEL